MVNIAIIIDDITRKAGTERAVCNLSNGLRKHYGDAYQITIISLCSDNSKGTFFELDPSIQIIHLDHPNNFSKLTKVFWYQKMIQKIRSVVLKNQFHFLIGTTYFHNILLPIIAKGTAVKTIGCEHEVYNFPKKWVRKIRQRAYLKLDQVVVLNPTERAYYKALSNVSIIPNSLSYAKQGESDLQAKTIIAVGRLMHQKGFDLLIEIMQKVLKKHPDWALNIFGDGEDQDALQQSIDEKNLGAHIKLRGSVKNITEQYLKSSIFALSSRWESFGLVIIEAMNSGLPVVSFDCAGPKNLIQEGVNGFLIRGFDQDAFAEKLCLLIENQQLRNNFAKAAVKSTEQYEEKKIMALWHQLLQDLG